MLGTQKGTEPPGGSAPPNPAGKRESAYDLIYTEEGGMEWTEWGPMYLPCGHILTSE